MANFVYNAGKKFFADKGLGGGPAVDLRIALLMTNTTADTENDGINFLAGFTTLDRQNGAGYPAGDKALTGEAASKDDANDRALIDANDATFTALGAGTRNVQSVLLYNFGTNDADSIPIAHYDWSGPQPDGSDFLVPFHANGLLALTQG